MGDIIDLTAREGAAPFTREQLQQLADEMTMGDVWRSVKDAGDDRAQAGMRSFYQAAKRIGMIDQGAEFEAFLDRVRQDDFVAVAQKGREGK